MVVRLRLVLLALLLLLLLLVAIPTQAFVPPQARPPLSVSSATARLSGTFLPPPSPGLHPRRPLIPTTPSRVHSTKRWSQKQQQQQQDAPTQPKKQKALEDLERRLKGHDGDEKSPVPFAYVTQTPEGKVSSRFLRLVVLRFLLICVLTQMCRVF